MSAVRFSTVGPLALTLALAALSVGLPLSVRGGEPVVTAVPDTTVVKRAPRVPWLTDQSWPALVERARSTGSPILIDFTATWCGPCKLLDVMVFTEKTVINELADVITLKIDIDRPGADALPRRFGIEVVPTMIWCDSTGQERDRFTGYVSAQKFLATLATWREGLTLDQVLVARQAAAPESPAVLLELGRRQVRSGRHREAEVSYRRLLNLRHTAAPTIVARGTLGLASLAQAAGESQRARDLAQRAASGFLQTATSPVSTDQRLAGMMEVADFQLSLGDTLGSLATWHKMMELEKRNPAVLEGFARAALAAGHDLEAATIAALRATIYSDKDAAVIGVLAECYFQRRLYDRALRWIEQSVDRAPDDERYREQRRRYAAARDASNPYSGSSR